MRQGLVIAALVLLLAGPSLAEEPKDATVADTERPTAEAPTLAERIGTPARLGVVLAELRRLNRTDAHDALAFARTLGRCGGMAAARGVVPLIRSAYPDVRRAALRAAGDIGVRNRELLTFVREAVVDKNERVAIEACRALAKLGDGQDISFLLTSARTDKRRRVRSASYRALRELTGIKLPNIHARWTDWWKQRHERASKAVKAAIAALETPPTEEDPDDEELAVRKAHGNALLSDAWIELALVRKTIEDWLYAEQTELRRLACEIVGVWRLPELAGAVRSSATTRWARPELKQASEEALRLLGVTHD